ncbi:hypothetical protein IFM89_035523 [Coptis chinensis]|uniref:KIB1-4 beta-propeller domain-containing protein n=1 Tax=Coptis chinensis TaxID=261450 RepID=A0A835LGR2_9MAGN|nr:hypothetical protein IFM89_035523 [Coptis chinensis]
MCLQSWSELPEEIVRLIAEKIDLILDFIRFGAVCQSWRYVTLDKRHFSLFLKPQPWLMLTADDGENNRGFYSVSENKIHRINLPEASGCHCFGSPFVEDTYYTANLPGKNRMNYITKAIVSMAPSSSTAEEQILVLIIYGGYKRLAFARPGDTTWSIMLNNMIQFDVLHLNGQFYAVDAYGNVRLCDTNGLRPVSDVFAHPPEDVQGIYIDRFYLVELRGELHLSVRLFHVHCDGELFRDNNEIIDDSDNVSTVDVAGQDIKT